MIAVITRDTGSSDDSAYAIGVQGFRGCRGLGCMGLGVKGIWLKV